MTLPFVPLPGPLMRSCSAWVMTGIPPRFSRGAANLEHAISPQGQLCAAIRAPGAPQPRMTLTLPALLDTRHLIILCTGQKKLDVFEQAMSDGPVHEMPVRAVLRGTVPVHFFWAP